MQQMRRKIQDILDDLIPLFEQRQVVDDREKVVGTPTSKQLDTEENEIEAEKLGESRQAVNQSTCNIIYSSFFFW